MDGFCPEALVGGEGSLLELGLLEAISFFMAARSPSVMLSDFSRDCISIWLNPALGAVYWQWAARNSKHRTIHIGADIIICFFSEPNSNLNTFPPYPLSTQKTCKQPGKEKKILQEIAFKGGPGIA